VPRISRRLQLMISPRSEARYPPVRRLPRFPDRPDDIPFELRIVYPVPPAPPLLLSARHAGGLTLCPQRCSRIRPVSLRAAPEGLITRRSHHLQQPDDLLNSIIPKMSGAPCGFQKEFFTKLDQDTTTHRDILPTEARPYRGGLFDMVPQAAIWSVQPAPEPKRARSNAHGQTQPGLVNPQLAVKQRPQFAFCDSRRAKRPRRYACQTGKPAIPISRGYLSPYLIIFL